MLRIICNSGTLNKELIELSDDCNMEEISQLIKSRFASIISVEIIIPIYNAVEKNYKELEPIEFKNAEKDSEEELSNSNKMTENSAKSDENCKINLSEEPQSNIAVKKELLVYNKNLTAKQCCFVEEYNLSKIKNIYQYSELKEERIYEYLCMFGLETGTASFDIFFSAVKLLKKEKNIEELVDKLVVEFEKKKINKTAIRLMLVHQFKNILSNKCKLEMFSFMQLIKIMIKEDIIL